MDLMKHGEVFPRFILRVLRFQRKEHMGFTAYLAIIYAVIVILAMIAFAMKKKVLGILLLGLLILGSCILGYFWFTSPM